MDPHEPCVLQYFLSVAAEEAMKSSAIQNIGGDSDDSDCSCADWEEWRYLIFQAAIQSGQYYPFYCVLNEN